MKEIVLADVSIREFLTNKFTLWLDLRTTDDDRLHGSGRHIENASEGVTIQITKQADVAGKEHPSGNRRTDRLRKNSFRPRSAWRPFRKVFQHIVVLFPTVQKNKTYHQRLWIWADPEVYVVDPGERLYDYMPAFYLVFQGEPTLYVIVDCSATKALKMKKDMLSELAFSGRHAKQSVWVLTQKYNSVLKNLREMTRWVALFHCKDRDSFKDCLHENDVIPTREEQALVRQQLAETKHAKHLLKTDQPASYMVC